MVMFIHLFIADLSNLQPFRAFSFIIIINESMFLIYATMLELIWFNYTLPYYSHYVYTEKNLVNNVDKRFK